MNLTGWTLAGKALNAKTERHLVPHRTNTLEASCRLRLDRQEAFPEIRMAEDGRAMVQPRHP